MDPVTLWILVLAAGWITRALIEDAAAAIAKARGHDYTSPRVVRREARQRLAMERIAAGSPPMTMVFSDRLARRIANPPERRWLRAARDYLDCVIADGFEDARARHVHKRLAKRVTTPETDQPNQPSPPTTPPAADDEGIVDAEIVDPHPAPTPEPTADPATGPDLAPRDARNGHPHDSPNPAPDSPPNPSAASQPVADHPRKDTSIMSNIPATPSGHAIINGDVGDPEGALAYCENTQAFNQAVYSQVEAAKANLVAAGIGPDFQDILTTALSAADMCRAGVAEARSEYADHVLAKADLTSNPDLRNTLIGYLSANRG